MILLKTSDHGYSLCSHHLFGKETMFEEAARVPWLIRLLGQTQQQMISHPVSHIDFVPTLLDFLAQPGHPQCAGQSLLPMIGVSAPGYSEEYGGPRNVFL